MYSAVCAGLVVVSGGVGPGVQDGSRRREMDDGSEVKLQAPVISSQTLMFVGEQTPARRFLDSSDYSPLLLIRQPDVCALRLRWSCPDFAVMRHD